MPIFPVSTVGKYGIIKDVKPYELPFEAWSDGQNIRFTDGYAEKCLGQYAVMGTPSVAPYSLLPVSGLTTYNWLYMGTGKVYVYDGTNHTNITRQTAAVDVNYTGTADNIWTSCVLGGIPVLCNGVDDPQMWLPATSATKLAKLSNWPASTKAAVMRNYKQFLVGLNITKSSTVYPQTLKWSHPADPGAVPSSWDETDTTKDTGEYTFSETGDWLVDCCSLRDMVIVYKENSSWGMQYIGGTDIFKFSRLFDNFGLLGRNCAIEFQPGQHCILALGDVIAHNGVSARSILTNRMRAWLANNINSSSVHHQVNVNIARSEVWIAIATGANTYPDKAIVWNWEKDTLGFRDLPGVAYLASGIVTSTTVATWGAETRTWDQASEAWGQRLYSAGVSSVIMAVPDSTLIEKADFTSGFNSSSMTVSLERTGLGIPFKQGMPPDFTAMKFIRNIWPRITGTVGGVVNVTIGTQMDITTDIVWGTAQPYTIGSTQKLDVLATGRLLALKFSSNSLIDWKLHGYELDVDFGGNF